MNLLHTVEFYHPSVGGMQEVVKQLSERLVRLGHEVTVATTGLLERTETVINGVQIAEFAVSGKLATGMTGEVERYRRFVQDSGFDVMTNFAAQQWATDAIITELDKITAKKVFVPTGFSQLHNPRFQGYFSSMVQWLKQYEMNVFLSNDYRDINFARSFGASNIMVIPNGAAEEEFLVKPEVDIRSQLGIPREHLLVLHVGSHTGLKGHTEAIKIFGKAQIRNATLLIVANDLDGGCTRSCRIRKRIFDKWPKQVKDDKRVIITTLLRQETVAAYHEADLFLFPSNIECSPLVLFECLASRTPFLTTDVGNSQEIIGWSGGGVLLPSSKDRKGQSRAEIAGSVPILEKYAHDEDGRRLMGKSGFDVWRDRFTWGRISRNYENLYVKLLAE